MLHRVVIDLLIHGGKAAAHPAEQLLLPLLGEFDLLRVLRQRRRQLLQPRILFIRYLPVQEHQRAVLREIPQQRRQRGALGLVQLEDVHIRHGDEGMLRHHGHGLHRLGHLLHRQPLAAEPVVVELLEARRHQQRLQLRHRLLHEVRLLSLENIDIPHAAGLHLPVQLLVAGELFVFLCCHGYPPFTVMRMFPCRSVRQISAPTASSRCTVSSDGWP